MDSAVADDLAVRRPAQMSHPESDDTNQIIDRLERARRARERLMPGSPEDEEARRTAVDLTRQLQERTSRARPDRDRWSR